MPYRVLIPTVASLPVCVNLLARIADNAWRGYSSHGLKWRQKYYSELIDHDGRMREAIQIIQYVDRENESVEECAFVSILPMMPQMARLHLKGKLSQYDFTADVLAVDRRSGERSFHYFQSIYMDQAHAKNPTVRRLLHESIAKLLNRQACGLSGRPFTIYAETDLPKGKNICIQHGLMPTGERSAREKPFFLLDSQKGLPRHVNAILRACSRVARNPSIPIRPRVARRMQSN